MAKRRSRQSAATPHHSQERDRCYTPAYALDPLLPYLPPRATIWESAAGDGHLVRALQAGGHQVVASEIRNGQDFFVYEPDAWDVQVTNPPYSAKYHWIERSYALGKPWALLLPLETLGAWSAQRLFRAYGVELLLLNRRVQFYMPRVGFNGGGANFPSAWFCWRLLPAPIVYGTLMPRADAQLLLL